jgi:hypothetical protein
MDSGNCTLILGISSYVCNTLYVPHVSRPSGREFFMAFRRKDWYKKQEGLEETTI